MDLRRLIPLVAVVLQAGALFAQAPAQSPRDAVLEVLFATQPETVERHLLKATAAALQDPRMAPSVRDAFPGTLMVVATMDAEGGDVSRG
ncbi:MAG TPA: hypothetical protein VLT85_06130 [Terriglobales bacterium]|nr:hypothetical protein [Terriglobales bacterium]